MAGCLCLSRTHTNTLAGSVAAKLIGSQNLFALFLAFIPPFTPQLVLSLVVDILIRGCLFRLCV